MYCKNCGNEVNDKAVACPKCGVNPKTEKNFCQNCGKPTNANQVVCIECGVSLKSSSIGGMSTSNFPIPLWVGFLINLLAWLTFVATFNSGVEFIMGLLCIGCAYIGFVHKKQNSESAFGVGFLTPSYLIYISIFDAIWMLFWAIS